MRIPIIAALVACHSQTPSPAEQAIGVRVLDAVDPLTQARLPVGVFYPASGAPAHVTIDGEDIAAGRDLPVATGAHPLVAISHGHGGSMWGHHDLAEALARHGYVVAVVEHIGDSYRDHSDVAADRVLYGRAYQLSAAIDRAIAALPGAVDTSRIGVAGFSLGGYTALLAVGAQPDFTRIDGYCTRHPDDPEICNAGLRRELAQLKPGKPTVDRRVRAAFVMAPVGVFFGPDAFRDVTAPVFLTWGTADEVLLPDENAKPVAGELRTLTNTREYAGAGHYVFLVPCSAGLAKRLPPLCVDPPGIDRAAVHATIAADASAFFDAKLSGK
jgi:predicted dienelactone hydrolase